MNSWSMSCGRNSNIHSAIESKIEQNSRAQRHDTTGDCEPLSLAAEVREKSILRALLPSSGIAALSSGPRIFVLRVVFINTVRVSRCCVCLSGTVLLHSLTHSLSQRGFPSRRHTRNYSRQYSLNPFGASLISTVAVRDRRRNVVLRFGVGRNESTENPDY